MSGQGSVVVVGGGISGLSTAFWLRKSGLEVTVLEAASHPGGTMRTLREDGWLVETGPTSALETTPLFGEMFEELGIAGERRYADTRSGKRYILRGGKLHLLPMSPIAFLRTDLWTGRGKVRLLKEPFIGRATREETVAEFVERRLGREFLDYAINPFVAGVFAGNPEQLSVRSAFPKLYALEERYGGLIKGMIRGAGERKRRAEKAKDRARMFSFERGMETFPNAVAHALGSGFRGESEVLSLARAFRKGENGARVPGAIAVSFRERGRRESLRADAVVVAVPAYAAALLVEQFSPGLADMLEGVYYPPVAEVFLGFKAGQVAMPLDGFGYLIPEKEKRNTLGTIWSSSLFPGRAPEGSIALTTFVGGSRQPELLRRDDDGLRRLVLDDLGSIMGVTGDPVFTRIIRWQKAIPQYNLGYVRVLEEIDRLEREQPGLFVCGNYRDGIAVGDCVMNSRRTAERVLEHLRRQEHDSHVTQTIGV